MRPRTTQLRELKTHLRAAEAELDTGRGISPALLETLRTAARDARAHGDLPSGLSRRLAQVESTHALRARDVDAEVLAGLYDRVQDATDGERVGRARVSNAYLEAPLSLTMWRRTAAAACVLAAISVAWLVSQPSADDAPAHVPSQVERYAILDGVLERYDGSSPAAFSPSGSRVLQVSDERDVMPAAGGAPSMRRGPMMFFGVRINGRSINMNDPRLRKQWEQVMIEVEKN